MKRSLPLEPPPGLVAYELPSGEILFVHPLPAITEIASLTPAEREVAALILDGRDSASISALRGTSVRTTANQVASIYRKVGVRSRAELAVKVYGDRA